MYVCRYTCIVYHSIHFIIYFLIPFLQLTYKAGPDKTRCGHQNDNHPVMVIVHGDDFVVGDAMLHPGHVVAKREVIVVTFNYRLGALGKEIVISLLDISPPMKG